METYQILPFAFAVGGIPALLGHVYAKETTPVPAVKVVILYPGTLEESVVNVSPPPALEIVKILEYLMMTTPDPPAPDTPCKFPSEV